MRGILGLPPIIIQTEPLLLVIRFTQFIALFLFLDMFTSAYVDL
jgi:hypothetical protein